MGVDASFFAIKTKKYYYFDRYYNVNVLDLYYDSLVSKYEEAMHALTQFKTCDYDNTVYVLNKNIEYWKTQPEADSHRVQWNESVLKFVQMFPEDYFFIVTDHEDPSYHEIAERDGYTQYQFPEDMPEPPSCHCPKTWCPLHLTMEEISEQMKSLEQLNKALSAGNLALNGGYLELANLDGNPQKIKV